MARPEREETPAMEARAHSVRFLKRAVDLARTKKRLRTKREKTRSTGR